MPLTLDRTDVHIRPLTGAIGADVENVDLGSLSDADFAKIEQAWYQHLVLRFRGQKINDVELMEFSRRFGQLDRIPIRAAGISHTDDPRLSVHPDAVEYVSVISNVKLEGKAIGGLGNYELHWHTDMLGQRHTAAGEHSVWHRSPPERRQHLIFQYDAAYELLDAETRQKIDGLTCIHDASRNSVGELRRGFADTSDPRQTVGAHHPLVRTHPVTKRKCLFLGRRRGAYIPEVSLEESEALLDRLFAHSTQPQFCWTQVWQSNDVVLWDNRCAMHRRDEFDDRYQRIMHRTQICGDRP